MLHQKQFATIAARNATAEGSSEAKLRFVQQNKA